MYSVVQCCAVVRCGKHTRLNDGQWLKMAEVAVRLWSEQWEAAEARRSADKSLMC